VLLAALGVGAYLAVTLLGDITQTRPDHVGPNSRSEIVLEVETNGYLQPASDGARNLWAACSGITSRQLVEDPGIVDIGEGRFRFSVEPGLGANTRRKLVGCLEDATIDRVQGSVVSVELIDPDA
jgi:hypothetical protein